MPDKTGEKGEYKYGRNQTEEPPKETEKAYAAA